MKNSPEKNKKNRIKANNSVNNLHTYKENGNWYYNDEDLGVFKEAFVMGSSEAIDHILGKECTNFKMLISKNPIPNYSARLIRRTDIEKDLLQIPGWYQVEGTELVHWLCGEILSYFSAYPENIFVKFEH